MTETQNDVFDAVGNHAVAAGGSDDTDTPPPEAPRVGFGVS